MEQITDSVEEPYGTTVSGQAVETTVSSTTTVPTTTTTVDIYNYDSVTENNKKFNAFAIDTYPLKIYITPNQNIINELAAQTTEKEARNKEISKNMIETLPFAAAAAILILYLLWAGGYDNDKSAMSWEILTTVSQKYRLRQCAFLAHLYPPYSE